MAVYFCNNKEMEELFELQNCYNELKDNYLQGCKELRILKEQVYKTIFKPENLNLIDTDGVYYILVDNKEFKELQQVIEEVK